MKNILVLEDSPYRISWLIEHATGANIEWASTVEAFAEKLQSLGTIDLIILDHDLGDPPEQKSETVIDAGTWPLDTNGQTGYNALEHFNHELHNEIPTIVWSCNIQMARKMVDELSSMGISAVSLPFIDGNFEKLKKTIGACIC